MNTVLFQLQDEEINQQSQLVEKLKTQMLDQEEVSFALASIFYFHCLSIKEIGGIWNRSQFMTRE